MHALGAALVSIEDPQESAFIQEILELFLDSSSTFWIGLYKTHEGENLNVKIHLGYIKLS